MDKFKFVVYSGKTHQPILDYDDHVPALRAAEKLNTTMRDFSFAYVLAHWKDTGKLYAPYDTFEE